MIPGRPWCEVCKKPTHNIDTSWKIHGKPAIGSPQENNAPTLLSLISLLRTKEQLRVLHKHFGQQHNPSSTPTIGMGSAAIQGNMPLDLLSQDNFSSYRIIDSGASDNMSSKLQFFSSYSPFRVPKSVWVADGSCTRVFGLGSIWLSLNLCLHNVLFVPALHCKLSSVSMLNKDMHCYTIFSTDSFVFQDLASERTIGHADCCAAVPT